MSSSTNLQPGAVFHGRYRVVRSIKTGGMGSVYEVVDDRTAAPRALKVMRPDLLQNPDQHARFTLEARVTGGIDSDHLVKVSDSGVDEATGAPFLVMELLRGQELGDLLAQRGKLPPAEVLTYLSQAARALDRTHAAGIVHRDLKPGNLFVSVRDDGSPCVKILDFGIAKIVARGADAQETKTLGTPLYMSPEQINGSATIGPPADLYALAQVAHTLLMGEPYWKEESTADESLYLMLTRVLEGAVEPPRARAERRRLGAPLPPAFDAWFLEATAVSPERRGGSATACIEALAEALQMPATQAAPAPVSVAAPKRARTAIEPSPAQAPPAARPKRLLPVAVGVTAILGFAMIGGIALLVRGGEGDPAADAPAPARTASARAAASPSSTVRADRVDTTDYLKEATSVPAKLGAKIGGPVRVLELVLEPDHVEAKIQDPRKHENLDRYELRAGRVGDASPVKSTSSLGTAKDVDAWTVDLASVNLALVPRMVRDAPARGSLPDGKVTRMILKNSNGATSNDMHWQAFVNNPHKGVVVEYDLAGRMMRVFPN